MQILTTAFVKNTKNFLQYMGKESEEIVKLYLIQEFILVFLYKTDN